MLSTSTMKKRILVIGVSGMVGSTVFKELFNSELYQVWGTVRSINNLSYFPNDMRSLLISDVDVLDYDALVSVMDQIQPDIVINTAGIVKQSDTANAPLVVLPINAMFPHRLSKLCSLINARLIHISTDCVFKGQKGMYTEHDISDAEDLYGKSKFIGEPLDCAHAVTLRTSLIGHEFKTKYSLLEWFLSQTVTVKGYKNAVFSGLPTVELARVIMEFVIPNVSLSGLYHIAADRIDKYSLLMIIADIYGKEIEIIEDEELHLDRSLDSSKFQMATGYMPPNWRELIKKMHKLN